MHREDQTVSYTVKNINNDSILLKGEIKIEPNGIIRLDSIMPKQGEFYLIEWTANGKKGKNHFTPCIEQTLDYKTYLSQIEKVGFDQFEGF